MAHVGLSLGSILLKADLLRGGWRLGKKECRSRWNLVTWTRIATQGPKWFRTKPEVERKGGRAYMAGTSIDTLASHSANIRGRPTLESAIFLLTESMWRVNGNATKNDTYFSKITRGFIICTIMNYQVTVTFPRFISNISYFLPSYFANMCNKCTHVHDCFVYT